MFGLTTVLPQRCLHLDVVVVCCKLEIPFRQLLHARHASFVPLHLMTSLHVCHVAGWLFVTESDYRLPVDRPAVWDESSFIGNTVMNRTYFGWTNEYGAREHEAPSFEYLPNHLNRECDIPATPKKKANPKSLERRGTTLSSTHRQLVSGWCWWLFKQTLERERERETSIITTVLVVATTIWNTPWCVPLVGADIVPRTSPQPQPLPQEEYQPHPEYPCPHYHY